MIHVNNSEQLQKWLLESGHLGRLWDRPRFHFDPVAFEQELQIVSTQYPQFSAEEAQARAALRLLGKEEAEGRRLALVARRPVTRREKWLTTLCVIVLILVLLCLALRAKAGNGPQPEVGEGYRSELGRGYLSPQGQPGGIIIQVANQGTVLATRPAGLLQFNCSTAMSCSFSGTTFTLTSTGGGGGSPAWSSILAPTGNLAINHAAFTTSFTWNAATGAGVNLFSLADTANNTGTGALLNLSTASGSALLPFQATALGIANGVQIDTTGLLKAIGTGGINATRYKGGNASGTGSCGANNWVSVLNDAASPGCAQPGFSSLSGSIALGQTPLTTRGDVLTVNSTPALVRLTLGGNNLYLKSNGSDLVYSTLGAGGVGSCTNQAVTALNADAAPTCSSVAGSFFANQIANLVFAGPSSGAAAAPSFRSLVKADQVSTTVYADQANTYTAGDQSLVSAASMEIPTSAGCSAGSTNGRVCFDTTQETLHYGDSVMGDTTGVRVLCAKFSTTDVVNATDSGATSGNGKAFATTCVVPANALIANKVIRVSAVFDMTSSGSPPTESLRLIVEKSGPTDVVLWNNSSGTPLSSQTSQGWGHTWQIQGTTAPGASVSVETGTAGYAGPPGQGGLWGANQTAQGVNVTTNVQQTIKIFMVYGAATSGNSNKLRQLVAEVLN